jgi:hypothetical protein
MRSPILLLLLSVGCQPPPALSTSNCVIAPQERYQYAVTRLVLPMGAYGSSTDGRPATNALGDIVQLMTEHGLDPQGVVDHAFATGTQSLYLDILLPSYSTDALGGAGAILVGVDGTLAVFCGAYQTSHFISAPAYKGDQPVAADFSFSFFESLREHLVGLRMTFDLDPTSGSLSGTIVGAVPGTDMKARVPGAIAALLTQKVRNDPSSNSTQTVLTEFDSGGVSDYGIPCTAGADCMSGVCTAARCTSPGCGLACRNPSDVGPRPGACAQAGDQIIDTCEVTTDRVASLLQPDLSLFDSSGNWDPSHTHPLDSFSFGVSFTATRQ